MYISIIELLVRRLCSDIIYFRPLINGFIGIDPDQLFDFSTNSRTRGHI